MIITLKKADFSKNNIGTLSTWSISRVLGNGATYSGVTYVDKGAALNATVTIAENYELNGSVTVTMGGEAVTSGITTNGKTITIAIASVTGNVVIKVPTINTSTGEEGGGNDDSGNTPDTPASGTVLTLYKTLPSSKAQCMYYKDLWKFQGNVTVASWQPEVCVVDVSGLIGKQLSVTAAHGVVADAWYGAFTNALLANIALTDLASFAFPDPTAANCEVVGDKNTIVEAINVAVESNKPNTKTFTVPAGAKYLYFTNLKKYQAEDAKVVVIG
jgi:hypothetical protein